jgi:hypothetical protein
MWICHNREFSTRSILFIFFLAHIIVFIHCFPISWSANILILGPKPELENYTATLKQISDFSEEVPTYIMTIKVISSNLLMTKLFRMTRLLLIFLICV